MTSLTGEVSKTPNTRAAAILAAHDFPFDVEQTFATFAGDGVKGRQVCWHFQEVCPFGNSSEAALAAIENPRRLQEEPGCTLGMCRAAFRRAEDLTNHAKRKARVELPRPAPLPYCETADSKKAAAMEQLGHKMIGSRWVGSQLRFQFHQASASDFALWELPPGELERRLPDAPISYLWCSFDMHRGMVDLIKKAGVMFATLQHDGRTAYVGNGMSNTQIDELEKLLTNPPTR